MYSLHCQAGLYVVVDVVVAAVGADFVFAVLAGGRSSQGIQYFSGFESY